MKKIFVLLVVLCMGLSVSLASNDTPKQHDKSSMSTSKDLGEKREIKNIDEYFRYLSHEIQRNWTPYKANVNYEIKVQFELHRDGKITNIHIVETTLRDANVSVIQAVKKGIPYQPLPQSFKKNKVTAQIVLSYSKN